MKRSNIKVVGKSEQEGGVLRPHNIQITENGEPSSMVQKFVFEAEVGKTPLVTMVSYPETIELELEGVEVHKEIAATRIFNECTEVMKSMDYDFRLVIKKKGLSWKTEDPVKLKEYLDTCYESLNTIMEQYMKGERDILDVTLFSIKLANYAVLLADRTYSISLAIKAEKEEKEKKEKEENDKNGEIESA